MQHIIRRSPPTVSCCLSLPSTWCLLDILLWYRFFEHENVYVSDRPVSYTATPRRHATTTNRKNVKNWSYYYRRRLTVYSHFPKATIGVLISNGKYCSGVLSLKGSGVDSWESLLAKGRGGNDLSSMHNCTHWQRDYLNWNSKSLRSISKKVV